MPGPIPERRENILGHRSKAELAGETMSRVRIPTKVSQPKPPRNKDTGEYEWHAIAVRIYKATQESGQTRFYEPSDWAYLYWFCDELTWHMNHTGRGERSSMKLQALDGMAAKLLLTEGERRRAQIEIDRGEPMEDEDAAAMALYAGIGLAT